MPDKVRLTSEMLDELEQRSIRSRPVLGTPVDPPVLRALIDAARERDELRREQDSVAWQHVTRPAAFALVERELREGRVHEIEIDVDEHGPIVTVRAYEADMSETVLARDSLLEAVDAAKAKAR